MAARKLLKADGDCELRSFRAPGKDLHQSLRDSTISAQQGPEFGFRAGPGSIQSIRDHMGEILKGF